MGVRAIRATSALLMSVWLQQCAAGEVRLERGAWPEAMACEACVNFQFGELAMRLPLRLIGRFFVAGSEASAVHLLAPGAANGKNSAVFLSTTRAAYIGKYQALGLPSVNAMGGEAFFDLLGEPAQRDSPFHAIRRIEGIDAAEHYLKTSKGRLHAYWVQTAPDTSQYLHLVVDGSDTIYTVAGTITSQLYGALLGGMTSEPQP